MGKPRKSARDQIIIAVNQKQGVTKVFASQYCKSAPGRADGPGPGSPVADKVRQTIVQGITELLVDWGIELWYIQSFLGRAGSQWQL